MTRFLLTLAVVAVLALAAPTQADTYRSKDVDCPVCESRFTVAVVRSWTSGGGDGDLGPRVLGGAVLAHSVWTCPRCRYSAWADDFPKGVKPETKKRILAGYEPMEPLPANVGSIPTSVKFDLAARVLAWEGADAERRGRILLTGAWAVRQGARRALRPMDSDEALKARLTRALRDAWEVGEAAPIPLQRALLTSLLRLEAGAAAAERRALAARKAGTPDPVLALAAAWMHRRTGEHARAAPFVEALLADAALPAPIRSAARGLKDSMGRERALQEKALPLLLEAARGPAVEDTSRTTLRISAADTLRRLGRPADAVPLFVLAVQDADVPAWAVAMIRHGLVQCGALEGENEQAVEAAEARARASLLKRLMSPKTARDAAELIGDSGDPSFYPALVKALSSKEEDVRGAAFIAFCRMEQLPLPEDARLALEARVRDGHERRMGRIRAISRLKREAHPASLPLFHEALSDSVERVHEDAVDGLTRCGGEPAAQAIFALLGTEEGSSKHWHLRNRLLALSGLANRDLLTVDAAQAWWKDARGKGREAWVLEGFRATGKKIASLRGRAAILVLLELLDHKDPWIRWNAARALHDETGERFGWHLSLHVWNRPGRRRGLDRRESIQVEAWRAWWAADGTNRPKWKPKR